MPSEEQVRAVRVARIAEQKGDVEGARRLLAQCGETWPDDPYLLDERLRFLARTGKDPELLALLRSRLTAVLSDPGRPLPISTVHRLVLDRSTTGDDLALLQKAVSQKLAVAPTDPQLLTLLADAQRRLQDRDGLAATLQRLDAVRPSHELSWDRLLLAVRRERWEEAKGLLDRIEAAGDKAPLTRHLRLTVLAHLGDIDAVLAAAGEPRPKEERAQVAGALQQIGWDLRDAGRDAESEAVFRKALALVPENAVLEQIVAQLFADEAERTARAQEAEARWGDVDNPAALLQEGSSRLVAGDAAGAYPLLQRASAALPEEPSAWYNLGLAAKKTARWTEAVQALERALTLRADWAPALRALADAQAQAADCPGAVVTARRAAAVDPASPEPYVTLFNCLQQMGDPAGAAAAKTEYERRKSPAP